MRNSLAMIEVQHHISECAQFCHPMKVICDAYTPAGVPIPTNKRHRAAEIFSNKKVVDEIPWLVHQLSLSIYFSAQ